MTSPTNRLIAELDAFAPFDDEGDNTTRLEALMHVLSELPDPTAVFPAVFALIERFPEAELGAPGPLVHELESLGGYNQQLSLSVRRRPTDLTVWMVNRILNSSSAPQDRAPWLSLLRLAAEHPGASDPVKRSARDFLIFQEENDQG